MLEKYLNILCDGQETLNELYDVLPMLLVENIDLYQVNIPGIINYIQLLDVQKLVHHRFDTVGPDDDDEDVEENNDQIKDDAQRIFGTIIAMRKIGDKQLSELCMMKHAKVNKILFQMLRDAFIDIESIPRSNDRDPKKSLYLWTINWFNVHKKILQSMYNSVSNLILKKRTIRKEIEILENDNSHKNTKQSKQYWMKLCAAFEHLTLSISKIDLQIALHRDY